MKSEIVVNWFDDIKLVVRRGMNGATGNIYCGLHEYEDMAFTLHLLRPGDLFVDGGANVGSYTILAAAAAKANTIAIEPDPESMRSLKRNLEINDIVNRVSCIEMALGDYEGRVRFTTDRDTTNQVQEVGDAETREVALSTLDVVVGNQNPILIKLDLEGYETKAIKGAASVFGNPALKAALIETTEAPVLELLDELGFTRVTYDPRSRTLSEAFGARNTQNALFVRGLGECRSRVASAPSFTILDRAI